MHPNELTDLITHPDMRAPQVDDSSDGDSSVGDLDRPYVISSRSQMPMKYS